MFLFVGLLKGKNKTLKIYSKLGFGFSTDEDKDSLYALESRKRKILLHRGKEAR